MLETSKTLQESQHWRAEQHLQARLVQPQQALVALNDQPQQAVHTLVREGEVDGAVGVRLRLYLWGTGEMKWSSVLHQLQEGIDNGRPAEQKACKEGFIKQSDSCPGLRAC